MESTTTTQNCIKLWTAGVKNKTDIIIIMNIFGGSTGTVVDKGPRGPRGVRGRDSSIVDLCTWLPHSVLDILQTNDENGAFFIENLDKDLVRPKGKGTDITQWVSRSRRGGNLVAKKPSSVIEEIEFLARTQYAMKFKTTHYLDAVSTFLQGRTDSCGFICITFRTNSEAEQVLMCQSSSSHHKPPPVVETEIRISGATEITIQVRGVKEIIQHSCKKWTTLFVEYNSDGELSHFTYDVNGIIGSFTAPSQTVETLGFHLGCRFDETCYLDGQIASVETYDKSGTSAPLPDTLKSLVIENQKVFDIM